MGITYFGAILIAFLVSLFIGSSKVVIGLGIAIFIMIVVEIADYAGWLD